MVKSHYNHKNNIYYITEIGEVSFEDKLELVNETINFIKDRSKVRVLHDMRKAKYEDFDSIEKGISKLAQHFKDKENIMIKHAAIHENALGTAISLLFEHSNLPTSYNHKIFYSKESALQWLLND